MYNLYFVLGYYNLCKEDTCGEHGTCELSEDEQSYVCQCEEGHAGEHCESESEFVQTFTFLINIHFTPKFMHYLILALSVFLSRFWPVVMTKRGITLVLVNVQGNDSNPCPDCIGRALNL